MKYQLTIEIRDKDGKIISQSKQRGRSFLKGYIALLVAQSGITPTCTDIEGTPHDIIINTFPLRAAGTAGCDYLGTVIGTGDTAVSINDYKLETKILEGVATGQMEYQNQMFTDPQVVGDRISFTAYRNFVNNSGALITVKEAGIDMYGKTPTYIFVCAVRDVLSPAKDIPDGAGITVTYTIEDTVG